MLRIPSNQEARLRPMASSSTQRITFLVRTSDKQSDSEKKQENVSRHRHAALVSHQRHKQKRLSLQPSMIPISHPGYGQSPPAGVALVSQQWRTRCSIINVSTAETVQSPRSEPGISLFDPFNIFVVDRLSSQAQDMFQSGKCRLPVLTAPV